MNAFEQEVRGRLEENGKDPQLGASRRRRSPLTRSVDFQGYIQQ